MGAAGSGLAILLLVGLLLRLTIAYVLLPGSGFSSDIGTFTAWAYQLGQSGPGDFYATAGFADYPPGYLYILWLIGGLGHALAPLAGGDAAAAIGALIKLPAMLADIAIGAILYWLVSAWRRPRADAARLGLFAAAIFVFNPVTWYDSAIWGQTDAVGTLVLLLTVAALVRGNSEGASVLAVIAALVKPQFGVVALPLVGVVLLRRHVLGADMPHNPILLPKRLQGWFAHEEGPWRLVSSAVAALIVLIVVPLPFSLDVPGLIREVIGTAGGYPWLSVNAYNPWALFGSGGSSPLAFGGGWSSDVVPFVGPIPAVVIGGLLLALGFGLGALRLLWLSDRRSIVIVTIFFALAFFMLPTRVHERYMFPIFGLLPLLAVVDRRWLTATVLLSIAAFINMHGVLTTELYATPNLQNLPLGDLFRAPIGIVTAIVLQVAGFAFVCWQLRPRAALEPDPYAPPDGFPDEAGLEWEEPPAPLERREPWYAPLAALVPRYSFRRDRSALLADEGAGRLDRRDMLLILLVFLAALFSRTYRLEQPYSMHFDEVYHARTAMEFLQDWRYGIPHSIYEYTHPHLAKYSMAVGIELLGDNQVVSSQELDATVRGATIEERWSPADAPAEHDGDRLYVAAADGAHIYDLEQSDRPLVATIDGDYVALAIDPDAHVLYLAAADGTLTQLPTEGLDALRRDEQPATEPLQAAPFARADLPGELDRLAYIGGQLIVGSSDGTLVSLDPFSGQQTGRHVLPSINGLSPAPARSEVVVDPAAVDDVQALTSRLAGLLGDDAAHIGDLISQAQEPVPVAAYIGSKKDDVRSAIDDGELPGVSIADGQAVAVATQGGVTLLDARTLDVLGAVAAGPVSGLALAEQGPDQPTLYAAAGDKVITIRLADDQPLTQGTTLPMPGAVEDVYWNPSTTMVHVLGRTPDGASWTVYVVEPRGNSVFADARLDFQPQSVVIDAQPKRPAEDRADLLALSSSGQLETVDIGNNQFAYRFPGVLVGALTAALIFLLARFLFRRRSIAVIVAMLVLLDGMFFANSRIAMNDTYVAFFIVAAFTLFVPLWLGRWRSGWATAGGLVAVGILLGLALASKWVGAYAIGGVGLLILLRSALGRWIALLAMISMTGVLGYMAVAGNPDIADPQRNYLFLLLMIGLSVLLAVGMALRPVRATADELRLAIVLPAIGGLVALAYGAYRLYSGASPDAGTLSPARLLVLGGVALVFALSLAVIGRYRGARGRGPWAAVPRPDPDAQPASPPPPRGWLRPGSGMLGLPWLLALAAIVVLPLAVYVISYIPWIELGNQWFQGFPAGHTGQTFLDLQRSMYDYHNNLRATHPASSPWWAWPLDLKPVWFQQNDYANGTTAVIYDTGNLVSFWMAIPAVAWACWQAWRRRSLSLAFIVIAIAALWLPWARIDRATFQYHIFTTLPFSFMALAYFLAELWHGPSARTWALARVAAALAIIGAPLLWLMRLPLCGIARTDQVNPGAEVCGALTRDFQLTSFQLVGMLVMIVGLVGAGILLFTALRNPSAVRGPRVLLMPGLISVALLGAAIVVVGAGLSGQVVFDAQVVADLPILGVFLMACIPAYFALRAVDPRRFVVGVLAAAAIWFVAFYPNFGSLPVPTTLSQIHLGLLPTWNWGFQFGVNLDAPTTAGLNFVAIGVLMLTTAVLCLAGVYLARNWSQLRAVGEEEVSPLPEAG